ncbi:hypothetical protein F5X99DRAFT_352480 [Biscogniauxia marginata]|nr:hypothetical protein F5X99DRAFT_352480 [Biscogniauxia marginata]
MDSEDIDAGLFGIQLSSDSDADGSGKNTKAPRNAQSEEAFQEVKRNYRVKVEDGEIWKTIKLPLSLKVSKPEAQALLHAVEELYFFRRYAEGARFARSILDGEGNDDISSPSPGRLDEDTRNTLRYYETKCVERAGESTTIES